MKLFSLIYGNEIHLSPEAKVIPQEEFSKALEGAEMIEEIKKEAAKYRQDITKEGERLYEESKKKGFEEGLEKWTNELKNLEETIVKNRKEIEQFIAKVALTTAKKVVGRELETNPKTVVDITAQNLKAVSNHKKVTIFVNKNDLETFEENKESLKKGFEELNSFTIQVRADVEEGGAIIETEAGIIDARAEMLWSKIEKAFEGLIKK